MLASATLGCAATSPYAPPMLQAAAEPPPIANRPVQTIRMEPPEIDGQTSWIIEPDVPRIPKINGLDRQLPPHIEQRLSRAFDLAQRGATYSANIEFQEVLLLCALELDSREGATRHRDAMREGLLALDEADEISGQRIDWSDAADVHRATAGHSTPVLRGKVPHGADAIQVVQLYYSYAEERFAYACQGLPGASVACYGMARTYVQPGAHFDHAAGKSAMLQRVALRIAPQNVLAGNELGVLLAEHGHLDAAESLFKQCVATDARPETWQNLATVYARKGNTEASRAAMTESTKLAARQRSEQPVTENPSSPVLSENPQGELLAQSNSTGDKTAIGDAALVDRGPGGLWSKLELSERFPRIFRK